MFVKLCWVSQSSTCFCVYVSFSVVLFVFVQGWMFVKLCWVSQSSTCLYADIFISVVSLAFVYGWIFIRLYWVWSAFVNLSLYLSRVVCSPLLGKILLYRDPLIIIIVIIIVRNQPCKDHLCFLVPGGLTTEVRVKPTSSQVMISRSSSCATFPSSWNSSIRQSIMLIKALTKLESVVGESSCKQAHDQSQFNTVHV